jgi:antagonist of KipI
MSASLDVLSPGLQTTVQDLGRWGYQASGVPVAGPMDPFSHRLANAMAGNARDVPTLEVAVTGPRLEFRDARRFVVTGAEFELFLDGAPVVAGSVVDAAPGAVLRFGSRGRGARAYIAVAGGFDVPLVLGSRATHVLTRTGGYQGRALVRGDSLPLGPVPRRPRHVRRLVPTTRTPSSSVVRVLPGPQQDRFQPDGLDALVSEPYRVSVDSDRTGFRLVGPVISHRAGADIISDATPLGSLQVPASGQPLLLMADRQTTGGYAKIATVISADIGIAGQAAPGDLLRFQLCTPAEASAALIDRERVLLSFESEVV